MPATMPATMRTFPTVMLIAAAAAAAVGLSGCAGSAFPVFDREQTADDLLPDDFAVETDDFDLDSTRHAGQHDGADFYLIQSKGGAQPCLVIVGIEPGEAVIACGAGGRVTAQTATFTAELAPAGDVAGESTGWTRLSENVVVRDND